MYNGFMLKNKLSEVNPEDIISGVELSIVNVILSVPEYEFPEISIPEIVAETIPLVVVDTVQGYIQTLGEDVSVIEILDTSPVMLMVGEATTASLKVAVIVTTLEPLTILSKSESVRVTVGVVLSIVNVILSVPE